MKLYLSGNQLITLFKIINLKNSSELVLKVITKIFLEELLFIIINLE